SISGDVSVLCLRLNRCSRRRLVSSGNYFGQASQRATTGRGRSISQRRRNGFCQRKSLSFCGRDPPQNRASNRNDAKSKPLMPDLHRFEIADRVTATYASLLTGRATSKSPIAAHTARRLGRRPLPVKALRTAKRQQSDIRYL